MTEYLTLMVQGQDLGQVPVLGRRELTSQPLMGWSKGRARSHKDPKQSPGPSLHSFLGNYMGLCPKVSSQEKLESRSMHKLSQYSAVNHNALICLAPTFTRQGEIIQ